jgi:DHA2 family multidrug resistance protein
MAEHGFRKWIITITVILASLLELVDTTVVNVSLPQIMGNLGATLEDAGWLVTAYAVANVIVLPMSGWLSLKFGRRNYFVFSIVLFTVSSFFCGNAHNIWELVAFRFIQGLVVADFFLLPRRSLLKHGRRNNWGWLRQCLDWVL